MGGGRGRASICMTIWLERRPAFCFDQEAGEPSEEAEHAGAADSDQAWQEPQGMC